MNNNSDETLIACFLKGDIKSFEQLVHRYEKPLWAFLFRFLRDTQGAEDVFQETFLRVYTKAKLFDPDKKFKTWIYTIAINLARTRLKKKSYSVLPVENFADDNQNLLGTGMVSSKSNPETVNEKRELSKLVREAVNSLSLKQQEVFILSQYQGLGYAEIATILGRPVGTIKSQMHYTLMTLREKLKEIYPKL